MPSKNNPIHIISLGAGVQSSTVALMAHLGELTPKPEFAVFADTHAEPANVYKHLEFLERAQLSRRPRFRRQFDRGRTPPRRLKEIGDRHSRPTTSRLLRGSRATQYGPTPMHRRLQDSTASPLRTQVHFTRRGVLDRHQHRRGHANA